MGNPFLEVSDLNVSYGDAQALWNVGFNVAAGEICTIIGSNGAGKSTVLKTIAGLIRPESGRIRFLGSDVTSAETNVIVDAGISLVPEGRGLFARLTVLENLELGAFTKRARPFMRDTIDRVFDLFPRIRSLKDRLAGKLSGGEQQMVAIGRALASQPELLMLDEPSLGLAPLIVKDLFSIVKRLNGEGVTILLVEQNIHQALKIAHSAFVLTTGRVVMTGTGKSLAANPEIQRAYMGSLR